MIKYLFFLILFSSCVFISDEFVCEGDACNRPLEDKAGITVSERLAVFNISDGVPTGPLVSSSEGVIENCTVTTPNTLLVSDSCELQGVDATLAIRPLQTVELSFGLNGESYTRSVKFGIYEIACSTGSSTKGSTIPLRVTASDSTTSTGRRVICNLTQLQNMTSFVGAQFEMHDNISISSMNFTDFIIPALGTNQLIGNNYKISGQAGSPATVSSAAGTTARIFESLSDNSGSIGKVSDLSLSYIDLENNATSGETALFTDGYYPTYLSNIYLENINMSAADAGVASRFAIDFSNGDTLESNFDGFLSNIRFFQINITADTIVTNSVSDPLPAGYFDTLAERDTRFDGTPASTLKIFDLE